MKENTEITTIAEAVSAVMRDTGAQVGTDGTNQHYKFGYVSIDKMMFHLRQSMAENGLSFSMNEVSFDLRERQDKYGKTNLMIIAKYEFWLTWKDQKTDPEGLTQTAVLIKEQTIGAIRSYAIKYWLRAKFMLCIGEEDLDASGRRIEIQNQQSQIVHSQHAQSVDQTNTLHVMRNQIFNLMVKFGFSNDYGSVIGWILGNPNTDIQQITERDAQIVSRFLNLTQSLNGNITDSVRTAIQKNVPVKDYLQHNNLV